MHHREVQCKKIKKINKIYINILNNKIYLKNNNKKKKKKKKKIYIYIYIYFIQNKLYQSIY